jgi:hypothetical protein
MKNMNNYEAPKAEVIELNVNKAFMQTFDYSSDTGMGDSSGGY